MGKPIVLKAADVVAAARKAYEEGRLSAQGPTPECEYRDASGRPCAIGAALTDEFVIENASALVGQTVKSIHLNFLQFEDPEQALNIQRAHDAWARATNRERSGRLGEISASCCEAQFRALIGLPAQPAES